MRFRSFQLLFAAFVCCVAAAGKAEAEQAPKCPDGVMKVLVTPFLNDAKAKSLSALSLGIAADISEALENDPCIKPIVGEEQVLTEEIARLTTPQGKKSDAGTSAAINRLALAHHATHILFGSYGGQVWDWRMQATLCKVNPDLEVSGFRCGDGMALGSLVETVTAPNGKTGQLQSSARFHALLGSAVSEAFANAKPLHAPQLAETTAKAIASPQAKGSKEIYPELLLARAYVRYFDYELPRRRMYEAAKTWQQKAALLSMWGKEDSKYTAQGLAAAAVRNDPSYVQAQRFFASLVAASRTMRNATSKARIHYEAALASGAEDFRTLMALGRLELDNDGAAVARGYFSRAAKARPTSADAESDKGHASLALGDPKGAMAAFERARLIDPEDRDARVFLASLYAEAGRYADAADEYSEIVRREPEDYEARFVFGALWQASGHAKIGEYPSLCDGDGIGGMPASVRASACKFAGDASMEKGAGMDVAHRYYEKAAALYPKDRRVAAILAGTPAPWPGGAALRQAIAEGRALAEQLESRRSRFQTALNDAVMDLKLNGSEGCKDGHGASSALLAKSEGRKHDLLRQRLAAVMRGIHDAFMAGEERALTPDLLPQVNAAEDALRGASLDAREMRSQFSRAFIPLYSRYRCGSYDGPITEAVFDSVVTRNDVRVVTPPKVAPAQGAPMYFSPEIAAEMARNVFIAVDNRDGKEEYAVRLADADAAPDKVDWRAVGEAVPGKVTDIPARVGLYRVCVVPKHAPCGEEDMERIAYLHDGWKMRIRSDD